MNLTAQELSGEHIGKTIKIPEAKIVNNEGELLGITHWEKKQKRVSVILRTSRGFRFDYTISNNTPITIQEEQ